MTETEASEQQIWNVVREIRDSPYRGLPTFQADIRRNKAWFFDRYPSLAEMCLTSDSFDEKALACMLEQKRRVNSSNVTQHEASVVVGEHLAKTYIPMYKNSAT